MEESTKETIDYTISKVQAALEALEGPAKHGYEVLVRQATVEGVTYATTALVGLVACVALAYPTYRLFLWSDEKAASKRGYDDGFWQAAAGFVAGLCSVGGLAVFVINGRHAIPRLLNPEFYAIRWLLGAL